MLDDLQLLAIKVANSPPEMAPVVLPKPALPQLLAAKAESDRRNFRGKSALVRALIIQEPHNFAIDSENAGIVGLTHSSGFKIHLPRKEIPTTVTLKRKPIKLMRPTRVRQTSALELDR